MSRWTLRLLVIALLASAQPVNAQNRAAIPVDLELVLAVDISTSVDSVESRLQRKGYVDALLDADVLAAIQRGVLGRIALTYVEWAGARNRRIIVPWTIINDRASAFAAATIIEAAPRTSGHWTSIGGAIQFSTTLFADNGFIGARRAIDISADGPNNDGIDPDLARDLAIAMGITINGLPIINNRIQISGLKQMPNYDHYFQDCVIGGRGAFMVVAKTYGDFATAIKQKLLFEISQLPPPRKSMLVRTAIEGQRDCAKGIDYLR